MNIRDNFPGTGMTRAEAEAESVNFAYEADHIKAAERAADDELNEAANLIEAALAEGVSAPTMIENNRSLYQRQIDAHRAEKIKQQEIVAAGLAKIRQFTVSIHSLEAALDSLLASEA